VSDKEQTEFEKGASAQNPGVISELLAMLKENKKFWLLPIVVALLLVGVIVILSSTAAAPFVYTLF
jgi:hypothetical protein